MCRVDVPTVAQKRSSDATDMPRKRRKGAKVRSSTSLDARMG